MEDFSLVSPFFRLSNSIFYSDVSRVVASPVILMDTNTTCLSALFSVTAAAASIPAQVVFFRIVQLICGLNN